MSAAAAERLIAVERAGGALIATLQRAPVNAINDALLDELDEVLDQAEADDSVSVLHLRSAFKVFCGGADLELIRQSTATPQGRNRMVAIVQDMQRVYARFENAPFVTMAEVSGACVGGGFELALACDWRIVANEARIGLPEAGLGLLPGAGGTQRLTALVGAGTARRLILGAETVDGAEALRLGLVQWAVPRAELGAAAAALARRSAAIPRTTLAENKRCITLADASQGDGFAAEIAATRRLYDNPETRRRVAAFLDKATTPKEQA